MKKILKKEDKFLDINYLSALMNEFKEVRSKEIDYTITPSDRLDSNSIYIAIFTYGANTMHRQFTLRISDHLLNNCPHKQFLIKPEKAMVGKRRQLLIKTVQNVIDDSKLRNTKLTLRTTHVTPVEEQPISIDEFLEQFNIENND